MNESILMKVRAPIYAEVLGRDFQIHDAAEGFGNLAPDVLRSTRVVVTSGLLGLSEAEMEFLPSLGLVCAIGTGYENVDVAQARLRGVAVTHSAGANAPAVAEHAIGLLLAVVRKIPAYFEHVRAGRWQGDIGPQPMVSGKRIGIYGMGGVGRRIGRIAEAMDMEVRYCSRSHKPDLHWPVHDGLADLAAAVDVLVVAAPGGPETFHAVDDRVLEALGPRGHLVNVGRGTVVDTVALVRALRSGAIAGAALDVFENEPVIDGGLRSLPNVVLTPHVAGVSRDAQAASADLMVRNIRAFLDGSALLTPVPESR